MKKRVEKINQVKMSLLPYFIEEYYPTSYHQFGSGYPKNFRVSPVERSLIRSLSNTDKYLKSQLDNFDKLEKHSHIGKDGFQVCLDVRHFQPNEISVKTENNSIIVNAKHEDKKDDQGFISREFTRKYDLPKGFKAEDVISSLSSDGLLSVKCPKAAAIEGSNVRHVEIQQTGPAKKCINTDDEKNEKSKL